MILTWADMVFRKGVSDGFLGRMMAVWCTKPSLLEMRANIFTGEMLHCLGFVHQQMNE